MILQNFSGTPPHALHVHNGCERRTPLYDVLMIVLTCHTISALIVKLLGVATSQQHEDLCLPRNLFVKAFRST